MQPGNGCEQGAAEGFIGAKCRCLLVWYGRCSIEQAAGAGQDSLGQREDGEGRGHGDDAVESAQVRGQVLVASFRLENQLRETLDGVWGVLGKVGGQGVPYCGVEGCGGGRDGIRLGRIEDGDGRGAWRGCGRRVLLVRGGSLAWQGGVVWLRCSVCERGGQARGRLGEVVDDLRGLVGWRIGCGGLAH